LVCLPAGLYAQLERGDVLANFAGSLVSDREKASEETLFDHQLSGRFFYFLNDRWALGLKADTDFAPFVRNNGSIYVINNYLAPAGRFFLFNEETPLYLELNLLLQQQGAVQNSFFSTSSETVSTWRFGLGVGLGSILKLSEGTYLDLGASYRYLRSEEELILRTGYSWQFSLHTLAHLPGEGAKYQVPLKKRAPQQGSWLLQAQVDGFGPGSEDLLLDSDASLGFFLSDGWVLGLNISSGRAGAVNDPSIMLRSSTGEGFIRYYRPIRNNLQWFPTLGYTRGRERAYQDDELGREVYLRQFRLGAGASYFLNRYAALEFQLSYNRGARNTRMPFNDTEQVAFMRFSVNLMHYLRK